MTRYRQTFSEALAKVKELGEAKYRYDGKVVFISKAEFKKINKDYKNATPGQERMVVLDPKTQATVSAPVKFEEVELTEDDHEISMARGELEAIADKALKLSSMLQGKTDDAQLEAWVQSKITKAKDYMNTVSDYMTYNPDDTNGMSPPYNFSNAFLSLSNLVNIAPSLFALSTEIFLPLRGSYSFLSCLICASLKLSSKLSGITLNLPEM